MYLRKETIQIFILKKKNDLNEEKGFSVKLFYNVFE